MSILRHRIEDARGRKVTQLDPIAMHLLRRHALVPAEELREIAEETDRRWTKWGHVIILGYAVGLLLAWGGMSYYMLFVSTSRRLDMVTILFYALQPVFLFGGFLMGWLIGARERFPRIRLVMLKHRRCPHCGYNLRGLPPCPDDDATACPECGCAWRLAEPEVTGYSAAAARQTSGLDRRVRITIAAALIVIMLGLAATALMGARRMGAARIRAAGRAAIPTRPAVLPAERTAAPGITGARTPASDE
jgi:hypothetical protein